MSDSDPMDSETMSDETMNDDSMSDSDPMDSETMSDGDSMDDSPVGASGDEDSPSPTASGGQPGFGLAVAAVGLLAGALLALRRGA
jgi:PGF-CTERM protein